MTDIPEKQLPLRLRLALKLAHAALVLRRLAANVRIFAEGLERKKMADTKRYFLIEETERCITLYRLHSPGKEYLSGAKQKLETISKPFSPMMQSLYESISKEKPL